MAHRGLSVRYFIAKFAAGAEEFAAQLQSSASSGISEALLKGMEVFRRQLTGVGIVTGAAMAPTLNANAATQSDAAERFLMRLIPRPAAQRTIFDGDVVAFNSPLVSPGTQQQIMVRRVAALQGDELTTEEATEGEEDNTFVLPEGYCWVLADNEALNFPDVIDSRTFGPLPMRNILGRVMYAARTETDHGPIENSDDGMAADAPVLEAELDLEKLINDAESGDE